MWQVTWLAVGIVAVVTLGQRVRPRWSLALIVACGLATGVLSPRHCADALGGLGSSLAFLVTAVPLALALEHLGFFRAAAQRVSGGRHVHGSLWVMATVVTAVLNLDASIVLLTPLYLHIAHQRGLDPLSLGLQPMLLAALGSSALPVSNLTNLIVAEHLDVGAATFLLRLGPSTLVGSTVGWVLYRRAFPERASPRAVTPAPDEHDRRTLRWGGTAVGAIVIGFVSGESVGLEPWMVAGTVLSALSILLRWHPWRAVPVDAVAVAAGLGILAAEAAPHLALEQWLGQPGVEGRLLAGVSGLLGSNLMNNLPALLIGLEPAGNTNVWPLLAGVNVGPVLWISGSLAGLLWLDLIHRHRIALTMGGYARLGLRLGAPPAILAVVVAAR